jgi:hypothetical protein
MQRSTKNLLVSSTQPRVSGFGRQTVDVNMLTSTVWRPLSNVVAHVVAESSSFFRYAAAAGIGLLTFRRQRRSACPRVRRQAGTMTEGRTR